MYRASVKEVSAMCRYVKDHVMAACAVTANA